VIGIRGSRTACLTSSKLHYRRCRNFRGMSTSSHEFILTGPLHRQDHPLGMAHRQILWLLFSCGSKSTSAFTQAATRACPYTYVVLVSEVHYVSGVHYISHLSNFSQATPSPHEHPNNHSQNQSSTHSSKPPFSFFSRPPNPTSFHGYRTRPISIHKHHPFYISHAL
jgi:hypothetical protein